MIHGLAKKHPMNDLSDLTRGSLASQAGRDDDAQRVRDARGRVLKAARVAAGLSAQKLADRVNDRTRGSDLTRDAIYSYERGKVLLNRDAAERLAEVLRMPLSELLAGDPDFAPPVTTPAAPWPEASTPATAVMGLDLTAAERDRLLHARTALLRHATPLLQSAEVLARQLERARPGTTTAGAFVASFSLVQDDARQLMDAPAGQTVVHAQRSAGFDTLQELLDAAEALRDAVAAGELDLFDADPHQPAAVVRACRTLASKLSSLLETLRDAEGRSMRLVSE